MASPHPSQNSIGTSSSPSPSPPPSPSPSPSSSLLDPSHRATPRLKSAWSQVVRGDGDALRAKAEPSSFKTQLQEEHQISSEDADARVRIRVNPSSASSTAVATGAPGSPFQLPLSSSDDVCLSPRPERRQATRDSPPMTPIASSDGSAIESTSIESKPAQSPAKAPKPAWGKPATNAGHNLEPAPVMGALSWPALSEARITKPSEPSKPVAAQRAAPKLLPVSGEDHDFQAHSSFPKGAGGNGGNFSTVTRHKPSNQHDLVGNGRISRAPVLSDTATPVTIVHPADTDRADHPGSSGGREARVIAASDNGSGVHHRGNAGSQVSNSVAGNRRNVLRDQGRGNHGWHSHGRGYANGRESNIPLQQHRVGPRNLPRPFLPFMNTNPGFVNAVGFQNAPGSLYYMPAPTPDPLLGATFFGPPAVLMHGPDPMALQGMLVKQIEYYFSVENLCKDIYLRSLMDDRGFIPISVIGNFNRVRKLAQNPHFILEALRMSNIVEIQGDRIRKRDDWANWLLPPSQQSATSSILLTERDQTARPSVSSRKAEDDHSRSVRANDQSSGVSHRSIAAQVGEKSERHSLQGSDVRSVMKDSFLQPLIPEATGGYVDPAAYARFSGRFINSGGKSTVLPSSGALQLGAEFNVSIVSDDNEGDCTLEETSRVSEEKPENMQTLAELSSAVSERGAFPVDEKVECKHSTQGHDIESQH